MFNTDEAIKQNLQGLILKNEIFKKIAEENGVDLEKFYHKVLGFVLKYISEKRLSLSEIYEFLTQKIKCESEKGNVCILIPNMDSRLCFSLKNDNYFLINYYCDDRLSKDEFFQYFYNENIRSKKMNFIEDNDGFYYVAEYNEKSIAKCSEFLNSNCKTVASKINYFNGKGYDGLEADVLTKAIPTEQLYSRIIKFSDIGMKKYVDSLKYKAKSTIDLISDVFKKQHK